VSSRERVQVVVRSWARRPENIGDVVTPSGPRILLVESDSELRTRLRVALAQAGFDVTPVRNGATALQYGDEQLDALVIDVSLPDTDGRDLCRALRVVGCTAPALFLTTPDSVGDRMAGFGPGGHDYATKPLRIDEVVARLRDLVQNGSAEGPAQVGPLRMDPVASSIGVGARQVSLTPTEFRVLAALAAHPGAVVRRTDIVRAAWPAGAIVHDNTLDQYIARLRRKLRQVTAEAEITTARGVGYRFG
jgi:two-component system OmpR family response regulator